jgi:hypothetical protein
MYMSLFVSLSLSQSITACLHSLAPHDTSLTTTPPSINRQSTQYFHFTYHRYQEITNRRRDARKREQAKVMQKAKDGAPTV